MMLMKKKLKKPSLHAVQVYFYTAQPDRMELWGTEEYISTPAALSLSSSQGLSALHYLHLPILPVMTIFIEFKNGIITY